MSVIISKDIYSAYYKTEGGQGIYFVRASDLEAATEYFKSVFGKDFVSCKLYERPKFERPKKK